MAREHTNTIDGYTVTTRKSGRNGIESFVELPETRHVDEIGRELHTAVLVVTEHLPGRGEVMRRASVVENVTDNHSSYTLTSQQRSWELSNVPSPRYETAALNAIHEQQLRQVIHELQDGTPAVDEAHAVAATARAAALSYPHDPGRAPSSAPLTPGAQRGASAHRAAGAELDR